MINFACNVEILNFHKIKYNTYITSNCFNIFLKIIELFVVLT